MSISNYSEMVTAVQEWLNRTGVTSFDDRIEDFIAFGQRRIMDEVDLKAMEAVDASFTLDAQSVALPDDLLRIRSIEIVDGLGTHPLEGAPLSRVLRQVSQDRPQRYDTRGSNLILGPTPDQSYTAILDYYTKLPILSSTQETNWFTDNFPEFLLAATLYEALLWLKDDVRAQVWAQQYGRYKTQIETSEARQARPYGQTAGARLA